MKVLIVARTQTALDIERPVLSANGFDATSTTEPDNAVCQLDGGQVDVVVVGGGIAGQSRRRIFESARKAGIAIVEGHLGEHVPAVRRGFDPTDQQTVSAIEDYVTHHLILSLSRLDARSE